MQEETSPPAGGEAPGANGAAPVIDQALFRRVMGSFASGVTVVTTPAAGEVRGVTVSAFMSGSLEPALCVISLRKKARLYPLIVAAGHFGVSILARDQEALSNYFASVPGAEATPQYVWAGRTPMLAGAASTIAAEIAHQCDCGDHTLFIGRIVHLEAHGRPPLVIHQGNYAAVDRPPG
jgi:flavin reductase (DIM6/NTAB) family NADH-FMN oxidoreductase RutF